MKVNIKRISSNANLPIKFYSDDFGCDLFATSVTDLGDGRIEYKTGLCVQLDEKPPKGEIWGLKIDPRSSIHTTGLMLSNGTGTIDNGYTGELKAVFYNIIPNLPNYEVGDMIGKIYFARTKTLEFSLVDNFEDTERGTEGYGHTNLIESIKRK